ncbi:hypothetical protein ACHAWF_015285 [Thalassiosira exigua]
MPKWLRRRRRSPHSIGDDDDATMTTSDEGDGARPSDASGGGGCRDDGGDGHDHDGRDDRDGPSPSPLFAPDAPPRTRRRDERRGLLPPSSSSADDGEVVREEGAWDDGDDGSSSREGEFERCANGVWDAEHWRRFLISRVRANPPLSVATALMGALTVLLWTDERFRFVSRGDRAAGGGGGILRRKKGATKSEGEGGPESYPAFPAKALLGLAVRRKPGGTPKNTAAVAVSSGVEPPYDPESDFQYYARGRNRTLLYWEEVVEAIEQTEDVLDGEARLRLNDTLLDLWTNLTTWGPCYPRAVPVQDDRHRRMRSEEDADTSWHLRGLKRYGKPGNWTAIVASTSNSDDDDIAYPSFQVRYRRTSADDAASLGGMCRPGFLIVGQGKCGTSSLYHYLAGHPRVLPAREKQIHYFRYHKRQPLGWYYSHFPSIESFLGRGALMTGEASPGYMPYPSVVEAVAKRLSPDWQPGGDEEEGNGRKGRARKGANDATEGSTKAGADAWRERASALPKIIAIVRHPVTRALSSYKYNYVVPALTKLRAGKGLAASGARIPGGMTDQYYRERHLFSFEELAYAELVWLKECLKPGGRGERYTRNHFGKKERGFFYDSVRRRDERNRNATTSDVSPAFVHLDEACYLATKVSAVPRAQWRDLAAEHPNKTLALPNLQLTQSILGRGAYAFPLEWWYEVFSRPSSNTAEDRIEVVCTEDLASDPEGTMDDLTRFLGLPPFDFSNVTAVGRYNVGGHRGYDTVTKSPDVDEEDEDDKEEEEGEGEGAARHGGTTPAEAQDDGDEVGLMKISDALRNELAHFYKPLNERLFQLIGKRCPWD